MTTDNVHPLIAKIISVRRLIESIEAELAERPSARAARARRAHLRDQSIYLEGLEDAAKLALTPGDLRKALS